MDSAARQSAGRRMPRPRSTRGNLAPFTVKSFASSSRVIGSHPSAVRARTQSTAAARKASSSHELTTDTSCTKHHVSSSICRSAGP